MATVTGTMATPAPRQYHGVLEWLTTVDHKKIGLLYIVTGFLFFITGGILALFIRLELAQPGMQVLDTQAFNQFFTMHGTTMIFLFVIPMLIGFGNYILPLMIGARDMAFPRLNAFGYWLTLASGIVLYSSFLFEASDAGWTGYTPLSTSAFTPGVGVTLWGAGLLLNGLASTLGAINFIVTIVNLRAPGMSMTRMPLFAWGMLATAAMILFATPVLTGGLILLLTDRLGLTSVFAASSPLDPRLWQHLFWFFGHPEVYIMILPAMGIVSEVLPVFSRKPIFGYKAIAYSSMAIAVMGFLVWAHHMFTTGIAPQLQLFFMIATMTIAVPTGIKIFNWLATLWGGQLSFKTPLLFTFGFLSMFVIGGISGVFQAIVPVDRQVQDSYYVVAHLHYVLFGGSVFGIFAGLYYWLPKMTGWMMNERWGKFQFWLMLIGFNLTFFPMHLLGLLGMPRRIADYDPGFGWTRYNNLSTIGAFLVAASIGVFLINLYLSHERREPAGADPWEANTLEWYTASPPPVYNFETIPAVHSERPLRDMRLGYTEPEGERVVA
ncbi:MAG TPA: cytochrome c oxidase subunit I [Anaerolineae bacterium]|nr:cytochrome c oxidase subunit I [Anaerolineae bacterium]